MRRGTLEERSVLLVEPGDAGSAWIEEALAPRVGRFERVADGAAAFARLVERRWDFVLTGLDLPDVTGWDVQAWAAEADAGCRVVMLSACGSVDEAVRAMRRGASHYLVRDEVSPDRLLRALERLAGADPAPERRGAVGPGFIGVSEEALRVRRRIDDFAGESSPVLVSGESGSGKDVAARAIHERGERSSGPFVAVNCAAIPEALFEGELFGAVRGAYTGAHRDRVGLLAAARDGTLLLDEIGELPLAVQAKLLRFLDGFGLRPLGATAEEVLDVRIIAATNRDLAELVRRGAFREDLYFRIDVLRIEIPPLRARPADVPVLARHFAERHTRHDRAVTFAPEALRQLIAFDWPGNARQLQNVVQRAMARQGGRIESVAVELGGAGARAEARRGGSPRAELERLLRDHAGDLGAVARALGVSVRTVQRRLARLGLRAAAYRNKLRRPATARGRDPGIGP